MTLKFYIKLIIWAFLITPCQAQYKQKTEHLLNECWTSKSENINKEIQNYKNWLASKKLIDTSSAKSFKESFIKILTLRKEIDPLFSYPYEISNQINYNSIFRHCLVENFEKIPSKLYGKSLLLPSNEKSLPKVDKDKEPLKFLEEYYSRFKAKEFNNPIVQKFLLGKLKLLGYERFLENIYKIKIKIEAPKTIKVEGKVTEIDKIEAEIKKVIQSRVKENKNFNQNKLSIEIRVESEVKMGVVIDVKEKIKAMGIQKISYL